MTRNLRVMVVAAEMDPFTADGPAAGNKGPAQTAGRIAEHIAGLGTRVSIIMPRYRRPQIDALPLENILPELWVPLGRDKVKASVFRAPRGNGEIFFIDNPKYFLRDRIFGTGPGDYLDNDERFAFFSRAAVEVLLKTRQTVDVIHCHSWPAALVPLFLRTHYAGKALFRGMVSVLSIHDPTDQGRFPAESLAFTGLNWDYFTPDQLALNGKFNFLKAGMLFADALAGAGEIGDEPGLAEVLAQRRGDYVKIPAGVDSAGWADAARQYLRLFQTELEEKKGGRHGR